MEEHERDFKGIWIPKNVWLDTRLNALDKVILMEIDSLDNDERGCYASNKYIADFCQCGETKVSKSISLLIKLGYLYVQKFDGRQRELKSRLASNTEQTCKIYKSALQNLQENNINNNIDNNKDKKEIKKKEAYDEILTTYTQDEETLDLLNEWLKVRKAKRAAMTARAVKLNLDRLDDYAKQSGMTVKQYLTEIIIRGWQAFYVINNFSNKTNNYSSAKKKPPEDDGIDLNQFGTVL